jgi:hypothetical protein
MITHVTDVLLILADVYQIVTNVYPMVVKESTVANPQKIDETNTKNEKNYWQHCIRLNQWMD